MSGEWAREADAMRAAGDMSSAASALIIALGSTDRHYYRLRAASLIRAERKRLGRTARRPDFDASVSEQRLLWLALESVAKYQAWPRGSGWPLRDAEAALRTLYKRGQA